MKLYCTKCNRKYLYCGKNHNSNNAKVSLAVCTNCQKNWSYHMKYKCENKYENMNSTAHVSENCDFAIGERENVSILRIRSPKL